MQGTVEALHDDSGSYRKATVIKVTDGSHYTVRFPDGDERTVRRNGVTLMGPTHFNEGTSLSDFPLTDPDAFGAPVPQAAPGARKRRRVTESDTPPTTTMGAAGSSSTQTGASAAADTNGSASDTAAAGGGGGGGGGSGGGAGGSGAGTGGGRGSRSSMRGGDTPAEREEAPPPTGTHHEVVLVNPSREGLDTGQLWWPALVVPAAEVMREMIGANDVDHKIQFVVRFFEDNLYAIIEQQYIKTLKRGTNPFEHFCETPKFLVRQQQSLCL